jgi:hypothetical protein
MKYLYPDLEGKTEIVNILSEVLKRILKHEGNAVRGKLRSFHDDELRGFARHLVPRGY